MDKDKAFDLINKLQWLDAMKGNSKKQSPQAIYLSL